MSKPLDNPYLPPEVREIELSFKENILAGSFGQKDLIEDDHYIDLLFTEQFDIL